MNNKQKKAKTSLLFKERKATHTPIFSAVELYSASMNCNNAIVCGELSTIGISFWCVPEDDDPSEELVEAS